jgi:hypothetical protein
MRAAGSSCVDALGVGAATSVAVGGADGVAACGRHAHAHAQTTTHARRLAALRRQVRIVLPAMVEPGVAAVNPPSAS